MSQTLPITLEVDDKFHLNNERRHPIGEIKPDGKIIVFSHNRFENGIPKNAYIAPAQQSIASEDWLNTFVTTDPFEWKALVDGVYILARKTLNGRYVVEKIREFAKGQTVRGFLPPREKVVVAVAPGENRLNLRIKPGSSIKPGTLGHVPGSDDLQAIVADVPIARDQSLNASGELSADSIVNKALDKLTENAIAELKEYKRTSKLAIDQNLEKYRADEMARVHAELAETQERVAALRSQEIELTAQVHVQEGKLKRNREEEKAKAIMGYSEDEIRRRTRARFIPVEEL